MRQDRALGVESYLQACDQVSGFQQCQLTDLVNNSDNLRVRWGSIC